MFDRLKRKYRKWKDKRNFLKKIKNAIYGGQAHR